MIPVGWESLTLEAASDHSAPIRYGVVQIGPHDPEGVPIVAIKYMSRISDSCLHRSSQVIERAYKNSRVRGGDVLLSVKGTIGEVCVVPADFEGNIAREIARIRPGKHVEARFLAYQLQSPQTQRRIKDQIVGSTRFEFSIAAVKKFEILLPTPPEQRRIAEVLDAWDDAIATAEKLVAAKERRLDWLRAKILSGDVRLSGFAKPWQTVQIGKVLTEHGETSTGREEVHSVSVNVGLVNQIEHLGRSFAAASTDHYNRVLPGDIVYTKSPTGYFPFGIIKQSRLDKAAIVSPLYGVFTPASRELGAILDTLFTSPAAAERLLAPVVQKGAKNTIAVTNKNFLKAQLRLPTDPREIVALSELVEAARAELDVHQTELKLLRNQRRGLMQKLLTGQWRVPEIVDALTPEKKEVGA